MTLCHYGGGGEVIHHNRLRRNLHCSLHRKQSQFKSALITILYSYLAIDPFLIASQELQLAFLLCLGGFDLWEGTSLLTEHCM
jgi:hypothetical protein